MDDVCDLHAFSRNILPTLCSTSDFGEASITVFNFGISIPSLAIEMFQAK